MVRWLVTCATEAGELVPPPLPQDVDPHMTHMQLTLLIDAAVPWFHANKTVWSGLKCLLSQIDFISFSFHANANSLLA